MTRRSPRAGSESGLWSAPVFPQPVSSFVGRRAEIDRITSHVTDDVLFLVYGVGGIGKSELVYQVIREICARPEWRDATPVLVDVRPGTTVERTLAQLLAATGAGAEPRHGQPTERAHLSEQLDAVAAALDARPLLLFIDDVHNLPAKPVGRALGYLARHVKNSRLFVASRAEIELPAEAAPPVITRLGPLDSAAATAMMDALSERMQLPRANPADLMQATHGSPFYIRRALAGQTADEDCLDASLASLSPWLRRVLMAIAVARYRPAEHSLAHAWPGEQTVGDTLRQLERRFLITVANGQLFVHDLVREPLLAGATAGETAAGHRDAAAMCQGELVSSVSPALLRAVDAVAHLVEASQFADAWRVVQRWYSALAAAGSDHLLRDSLDRLLFALPEHRVLIELLIVRSLVRASMIEDAEAVLARVSESRSDEEETRYCALAGEIAQRKGQLGRAEQLFEQAVTRAPTQAARFQAQVHIAGVAVIAGESARARQVLEVALAELPNPSPRQRARWAWVRTISWMFEERFEKGAEQARRARAELAGTSLDDLDNRLAMLETLSSIECDDMNHARVSARLIRASGLRQHVAAFYRAIASYADGEPRRACAELRDAHEYLRARGDTINAYLAGYYGTYALAAVAKLGEAQALARSATQLARDAGLRGPTAQALARQAVLAAEALQVQHAHQLADEALASPCIQRRSRATAHCAHAHAYTLEGDIGTALEHIALAREAVALPDLVSAQAEIDVEHAGVDLIGGNLHDAVERAERAVAHYKDRSRYYEVARARVLLAAAYIARGRRTDILFAEQTIAQAREHAERGDLHSILIGCAILTAALARRQNRGAAAEELLANALRSFDPERSSIYAGALLAAIEGGAAAWAPPGVIALLAHLGFTDAVGRYLVDQHGRRAATENDVERESNQRELFVDEVRSVILAHGGEVEISGRPMQCSLLSELIQAGGAPVPAESLYKRVWGVSEYHPLRHRNALYVAINRLRKGLREAFGDREIIERSTDGWRLADGVDVCTAVAVQRQTR